MEKITLDSLTISGVSIRVETLIEAEGQMFKIKGNRKAYENSVRGRAELLAEISEPFLSGILAVWGEVPTVTEVGVLV